MPDRSSQPEIRVCVLVHQYYHRHARVRRYAEALADAGAQVDVLCVRDPNHPFAGQRNGVRILTIPVGRGYRELGSYLFEYGAAFVLFSARLLMLHIKNRYQVIQVHNMPDFMIFTALIPRIFRARLILDICDPMPEFYMSKCGRQRSNIVVRLMEVQEKFSSMFAHAVITANSNFKANLVRRGIPADKIMVISNMPDTRLFNRSKYEQERRGKSKHFTLIYPGTIAPRYGLEVAIRALPLLKREIPQLRLLIIGQQTGHARELATLAKQLGVSPFVQFKHLIPVDEVPRQIIQADVGIYPSRPDPHMSIAMPAKVLEYAVMGIPVIASRLKVLDDTFTNSAMMFFEPGNVEQFARCVLELFENPARRDELVRNADDVLVHTRSWSDERQAYFSLLERLVSMRGKLAAVDERDREATGEAI
jgi:glycosyltransferase involved in cell wall biosynthesis